ncbi:MAG: UDP-N-acetylglucosamine 2-epimerase (non-hydrolyzing) [Pacificimonas sp.]
MKTGPCLVIVGTRPEAIKLAPVIIELRRRGVETLCCATGQHPDMVHEMLSEFGLAVDIDVGKSARSIKPFERLSQLQAVAMMASLVIVQGDTMSAFAGAVAASLSETPLAHVEAGLRTGDFAAPFPEEALRIGIARLADIHFAPTSDALANLRDEGIARDTVHLVGNTIVDAVRAILPGRRGIGRYVVLTTHRREHDGEPGREILRAAARLSAEDGLEVVYPAHPRTPAADLAIVEDCERVRVSGPLPYSRFLPLLADAALVITDSGGVQEEAATLGVPLVCARTVTERPQAVAVSNSILTGPDEHAIVAASRDLLSRPRRPARSAVFGDGHAAERIADTLIRKKFASVNQHSAATDGLRLVNP